jgi:uncharacterized protein
MQSAGHRPRVVVDTNVFVSGIIAKRGAPHDVVTLWQNGGLTLLISTEQVAELEDVLNRPRLIERHRISPREAASILLALETGAIRVAPRRRLPVHVLDPKDEHILGTAIGGRAEYLITGDDDLLVLNQDVRLGTLRIVTPRAFIDVMTGANPD